MNLPPRPFLAILRGQKKVEVRANRPHGKASRMRKGDVIIFHCNDRILRCTIERISLYPSVRSLLMAEGTSHTLSSGKGIEDGIRSIEAISDYKEKIARYGVFAIALRVEDT